MSTDPQNTKPVMNYNIRASQDGQWLWMISVSKGGVPFRVTDWDGVASQANQYDFHPKFIDDESSAWTGSLSAAQNIQRVLAQRCNTIADIYERDSHALVKKG
ncbi:MAG: hypothetical protein ABSF97_21790 [Candidatus Sulfotelmatobacter sp.]|jgi:hypothetical protein